MKIRNTKIGALLKTLTGAIAIAALLLVAGGRFGLGQHSVQAASTSAAVAAAPMAMPLGLPSVDSAKTVLGAALQYHHPQYLDVPMGATKIRAFVTYPDLAGKLPVVVVTANQQGMSDWVRAVGIEVVNEGFISVVPDVLSGMGPNGGGTDSFAGRDAVAAALSHMGADEITRRTNAVRDYFTSQPGANGKSAVLDFDFSARQLSAAINVPAAKNNPGQHRVAEFDMTEHAWHNTVALLWNLADPQVVDAPPDAAAAQRAGLQALAKRKDIPPGYQGSMRTMAESPRHGEWVDIAVTTAKGPLKLHSWVVQPLGNNKAPVVVMIMPGPGMDMGDAPQKGQGANWLRAVADQLASEGFITIVPDLTSGLAPGGGNFDSFQYPDDVGKALQSRTNAERMELVKDARDYAVKLPRANGKSGMIGFCLGGGMAWESSATIPGLSVAVSFYGAPPNADAMAKINVPVIAFAGDQDPGLAPRVSGAAPDMAKLGKTFEFRVYPGTTHAFLYRQDLSLNSQATLDSWPRAIAFFKKYFADSSASAKN